MNLDFFNPLKKEKLELQKETWKKELNLNDTEIELAEKLNAIEEYTVDRIEEDLAVLENRRTGEIKNISKSELPKEIIEGSILKEIRGKYTIDQEKTEEIEKRIEEKVKDLWKE